jgi:carboxylesterase type B
MYLFTWTTPRLAKHGAYHGLEIPFVFGTLVMA